MDFLLDNFLTNMDAYAFLVLYLLSLILSVLGVLSVRSLADKSERLSIPAIPPEPDPYEIAYLRGGENEAARSVVFALVQKGLIDIVNQEKVSTLVKPDAAVSVTGLNNLEQAAIDWLGGGRETGEVFNRESGLIQRLQPYLYSYQAKLETSQLLTLMEENWRIRKYAFATAGIFALLGGYRVFSSLAYGNFNVAFTVLIAIVGVIILVSVGRLPRSTKLGKQYLQRLQSAFEDMKYRSQAPYIRTGETHVVPQASFAGVDPLLLSVGLFGSSILAGTVFDDYNAAFHRSQSHSGGCGSASACGSGCSSGSDGGGGSSGCGGGGCGGGCGG